MHQTKVTQAKMGEKVVFWCHPIKTFNLGAIVTSKKKML